MPESTYLFRVIAYNENSISYPAESQDEVIIELFIETGFLRVEFSRRLRYGTKNEIILFADKHHQTRLKID